MPSSLRAELIVELQVQDSIVAGLFAAAGAALAFVRVAGQDLTSWCAALVRYALASRLAVYGPSHPR